jgi:signal transduction histidine kinase
MEREARRLSLEALELKDVVLVAISEARQDALEKGVKIALSIPDGLPRVRADFAEFKHALSNILDNAIKFNREGGRVDIKAEAKGGLVEVTVRDTGIGIGGEHLEKVFDRFYQVDTTTTRRYSGTGMGLAVAKEIVEAHGGRIWAESKPGGGSTFHLTLPTAKEENPGGKTAPPYLEEG